jgi:toxin FitB
MEFADCAMAALALRHGMTLVTRNTTEFKGTVVALLNPWLNSAVAG